MIQARISLKNIAGFDAQLDEVLLAVDANLEEVAQIVKDTAKSTSAFTDKTGNLRRSIKKKKSKFENGGYIVSASGRNRGDSTGDGEKGFHAHLVEFGHQKVLWGKFTDERVEEHPFMRPAKEAGLKAAISLFRGGK